MDNEKIEDTYKKCQDEQEIYNKLIQDINKKNILMESRQDFSLELPKARESVLDYKKQLSEHSDIETFKNDPSMSCSSSVVNMPKNVVDDLLYHMPPCINRWQAKK